MWQLLSAPSLSAIPSKRSSLDQITARLIELDLGFCQLSCRIENVQHDLLVEDAAPLEPDGDLAPSFRLIVTFLLPNDEGGVSDPERLVR